MQFNELWVRGRNEEEFVLVESCNRGESCAWTKEKDKDRKGRIEYDGYKEMDIPLMLALALV